MTGTDTTDQLKRYGTQLQSAFVDEAAEIAVRVVDFTPSKPPSRLRYSGKVAVLLLFGATTVASLGLVADASVPGQLLYAIDQSTERVLDAVGLGTADQRLAERTHEAEVLIDLGKPDVAVDTLLGAVRTEFGQLTPEEATEHTYSIMQTAERAVSIGDPSDVGALADRVSEVRDSIGVGKTDTHPADAGDQGGIGVEGDQ